MKKQLIERAPNLISGLTVGAISGFLFYHFFGCNGNCLIFSSPWVSTGYGAFLGMLLSRHFSKNKAA